MSTFYIGDFFSYDTYIFNGIPRKISSCIASSYLQLVIIYAMINKQILYLNDICTFDVLFFIVIYCMSMFTFHGDISNDNLKLPHVNDIFCLYKNIILKYFLKYAILLYMYEKV